MKDKFPISDNLKINEETLPVISQLAESLPGGFFIYHADGDQELIYFNSQLVALFGCENDEEFKTLTGNKFKGIVHPDDYPETENEIVSQIKKSAERFDHVRYRFIRKDGSVGVLDDYGHFSSSETFGEIYYVFVQDITDQHRKEIEHQHNIARIMALEDNFESLYDVDLETGEYEQYVKGQTFSEEVIGRLVEHNEFFSDVLKNVELVVYPEDREYFKSVVNRDFCRRILAERSYYDAFYRLLIDDKPVWFRMRLVYKDNEKRNIVFGSFNAEAEMEAKLKNEQIQKELIDTFTKNYETVFVANVDDASYTVITGLDYLNGFFPGNDSLFAAFRRYVDEAFYPPDREQFEKKLFSSDNLGAAFAVNELFNYEYRRRFADRNVWYRVSFNRINKKRILVGFENCDIEHLNDQIDDKLMSDFDGIYVVNLDRGKLLPVRISSASKITFEEEIDYTPAVRVLAETVDPKYRQDWLNFSDIEFMRRYMDNSDHREYVYELPGAEKVMRRFSIDILEYNEEGEPSVLLHSFAGIDDDRAAAIRLHRQLAEHRSLLQYFVDQYWSACFIDLANDTLEIIRADNANTSAYIMDGTHEDMERFIESHFHPDDIELMLQITDKDFVRKELKDNASVSYTAREIINGEERTMRILIVRGADEDHVAVGFMDVTDEIIEQQERLLGAVPISPDILTKANIGLWAFELDEGQPPRMYGDEAMLNLVGLEHQVPPEEMYHAWYDHIDESSYDLVSDAVEKMMTEHAEVQYPWHHPDGHTMIVRCGGVRNFEYTKGVRIEGTHQDVSETLHFDEEQREREEKQRKDEIARIAAETSNRAKTEFLFNMSHDIRTPMNAILGYTDLAINHVNDADRISDSLRKIKMSGNHLLNLINDILEMSRIEAGKLEISKSPISAKEATEGIRAMCQALASTKDITFNVTVGEMKNPYAYADELHVNQIVINLISNAIKYTNPGGNVDYRIEQISEPENGIAIYRMTVSDNGIGMTEEFQKHLFESFSREDSAAVAKQEGTGLGLAIVKRIVDILGGTITVQSKKDVGSTFVVELPFEIMDETAIKSYEAERGKDIVPDGIEFIGKKVLIVEDNEMNREIAEEILEEAGLQVESVEDGIYAVDILKGRGPDYYDFILMDIQMPIMNGYEATRAIRAMYPDKNIPIIAVSANAFEEDKKASLEAGMNGHVSKPIVIDELFSTLAKFM